MSTNRNIVEMVEAIRKGTGGSNSADGVDGTYGIMSLFLV